MKEHIDTRWQFSPTTYLAPQHTLWGDKRGYHPDPSFFMKKKNNRKDIRTFRPETEPHSGETDGS